MHTVISRIAVSRSASQVSSCKTEISRGHFNKLYTNFDATLRWENAYTVGWKYLTTQIILLPRFSFLFFFIRADNFLREKINWKKSENRNGKQDEF